MTLVHVLTSTTMMTDEVWWTDTFVWITWFIFLTCSSVLTFFVVVVAVRVCNSPTWLLSLCTHQLCS